MYQCILFDLDGTITNPQEGITKSIQYALKNMGIEADDLELLAKYIGPPLRDCFSTDYGFDEEQTEQAIRYYREYYAKMGIFQNQPYQGINEMLSRLVKEGKKLLIATSKPEVFAKQIMDHFDLSRYFIDVCGSTFDASREKKGDVIRYALSKNHITELNQVVMIGDRYHDIMGAKENEIASIGVLYGFGSSQEFVEHGADRVVETVEELTKMLLM
ncbi:MAG: phosphatase [Lachnospiraceae bacterium]|jgi:phosphoglycolate phosphatase|nr:phosphatase [Lachnospiraceae bacterium]